MIKDEQVVTENIILIDVTAREAHAPVWLGVHLFIEDLITQSLRRLDFLKRARETHFNATLAHV